VREMSGRPVSGEVPGGTAARGGGLGSGGGVGGGPHGLIGGARWKRGGEGGPGSKKVADLETHRKSGVGSRSRGLASLYSASCRDVLGYGQGHGPSIAHGGVLLRYESPGAKYGTRAPCWCVPGVGRGTGHPTLSAGNRRYGGQRPRRFSRAVQRPWQCIKSSEKGQRGIRYEGLVNQ